MSSVPNDLDVGNAVFRCSICHVRTRQALELLGTFTAEQWGMITSQQANALGVDDVTLHRLEQAGHIERVRRGVYAATIAVATEAREEQAVWLWLAPATPAWTRPPLDPDSGVLSHQSAARLHHLGELVNNGITLITPRRRTSRDPDLRLVTRQLDPDDVTTIDGLPVTTALRTICDLLEQHIDGSHIATIIRQAVEGGLVQLDMLAERLGPYALRYGVRPAGDGEALLERLLAEIGTTTARLAHRPAPPRTENALAVAQLPPSVLAALSRHNADVAGILNAVTTLTKHQEQLVATLVTGFKPLLEALNDNQPALGAGLSQILQALEQHETVGLSPHEALDAQGNRRPMAFDADAEAEDDDDGHTATTTYAQGLPRLPDRQGQEQGEGNGRERR